MNGAVDPFVVSFLLFDWIVTFHPDTDTHDDLPQNGRSESDSTDSVVTRMFQVCTSQFQAFLRWSRSACPPAQRCAPILLFSFSELLIGLRRLFEP